MSPSRSAAVARTATRLLLSDPAPVLMTAVMPMVFAPFVLPSARAQLRLSGYPHANGSEQVVPGLAVLFSFMSMALVCSLFFREHAWGTWERLRVTGISVWVVAAGKVAPLFAALVLQTLVAMAAAGLLFGYRPNGSLLALGLVVLVLEATVTAFGVLMVASFRTMDMAMVVGNLAGMVMAGGRRRVCPRIGSAPLGRDAGPPHAHLLGARRAQASVARRRRSRRCAAPGRGGRGLRHGLRRCCCAGLAARSGEGRYDMKVLYPWLRRRHHRRTSLG